MIEAVVFDLDGVLLDSEEIWDRAREELARERGGRWHNRAQRDMMGMSSTEWSRYMADVIGLPEPPEEINREVVHRLTELYREELPAIAGAREAVERLAARWPLGLASSSNRELIDLVLESSGLGRSHSKFGLYECVNIKLVTWEPSRTRDFWWQPYDQTLGEAVRATAKLLYGRNGQRVRALREGGIPLLRVTARTLRKDQ